LWIWTAFSEGSPNQHYEEKGWAFTLSQARKQVLGVLVHFKMEIEK
jgi:hypothetical protein